MLLLTGKLIVLSVLIFFCNEAESKEYYIIATTGSKDVCPMQPCTTLSNFAANLSKDHDSDNITVLNFLTGNHSLNVNLSIVNTKYYVPIRLSVQLSLNARNLHIFLSLL